MNKTIQQLAFFMLAVLLLTECSGENSSVNETETAASLQPAPAVKEDSITAKIRPVLFEMENQDLSFNGKKPFDLTISDIQYSLVSMKTYYTAQLELLKKQVKYSTNKEKTDKALAYLVQMVNTSADTPAIYLVQYHMRAIVDKTNYNQQKNIYLEKDLTRLQLIFPQ